MDVIETTCKLLKKLGNTELGEIEKETGDCVVCEQAARTRRRKRIRIVGLQLLYCNRHSLTDTDRLSIRAKQSSLSEKF